jgi:hypothetical protein
MKFNPTPSQATSHGVPIIYSNVKFAYKYMCSVRSLSLTCDFDGMNIYVVFCFKDKVAAVRAQAVMALQRLQDPTNPECPVIKGKKLNV